MSLTAVQIEAQRDASAIDGMIYSWEVLSNVPTADRPLVTLPIVLVWVERSTGIRKVVRLLEATDETNTSAGIQRPRDFDAVRNPRVWFAAG